VTTVITAFLVLLLGITGLLWGIKMAWTRAGELFVFIAFLLWFISHAQ